MARSVGQGRLLRWCETVATIAPAMRFETMLRLVPLIVLLACGAPIKPKEPPPAQPKASAPVVEQAAPGPASAAAPDEPKDSAAVSPEVAAPVPAKEPASAPTKETAVAAKTPRVHIIGASVSGGFKDSPLFGAAETGDTVPLLAVMKRWAGDGARVTSHNPTDMIRMFEDPTKFATDQMTGVQKAAPDFLLAIDFAFWFAYGPVRGDESVARSQKLAAGLAMLDKIEVPVLLGDLPDMRGAARRMLAESWIPSPALLKQLNDQLAAFVRSHENIHLVPLADLVRRMKDDGVPLPLATGPLVAPPGSLQQADRLHATRLGMAYLAYSLQEPLARLFPEGHALRAQRWTFEQFVEAAGADGDLEQLRELVNGKKVEPAATGK